MTMANSFIQCRYARAPWRAGRGTTPNLAHLLRDSYLATQQRECFQDTTLAGVSASAALGGKERLLWRIKFLT